MKRIEFKKGNLPKTPQICKSEAYRYYENAKDILKNISIEYGLYTDTKSVQKACAIGYLAALFAIDSFLLSKGILWKELPTSIDGYWAALQKYAQKNGRLTADLTGAYENLHILGYYRGGTDVEMIKSGFKRVKDIIDHFAQFIK